MGYFWTICPATARSSYPTAPRTSSRAAREPRGLRRRLARLFDKQGDAKVTDRAPTLSDCGKARAFTLYDQCKARDGLCP